MGRYLLRRLLHSVLVFGQRAVRRLHHWARPGRSGQADAADRRLRRADPSAATKLGLEDPFLVQFGRFAGGAAVGDFGDSLSQKVPALGLVVARIRPPST